MFYLFYGDDDYLVRRTGAALADRYASSSALSVSRLDGATVPWNDVVAACSVLPFLSAHQVVRVAGLLGASARRRSASGDDPTRPGASPPAVVSLARALPETTILVLEEGPLQSSNAHLKAFAAAGLPRKDGGEIRECPLVQGQARVAWVRDEVARRGGGIAGPAATLLADRLAGPLWPLSNAIDTLIAYAGPAQQITRAAVESLVALPDDENLFHLTDAIAAKDVARALTLWRGLLAGGMAEEQALAALTGRVRDWTLVTALKAEGVPEPEAIRKLGWNANRYRMVARGCAVFARGELPRAYQALVITDEALKSRPGDERPLILDLLVFTLATRGDPEGLRQTFPIPLLG